MILGKGIAGVYGILTNVRVPEWAANLTVGEVVGWIVGVSAAIAAASPVVRGFFRAGRSIVRFLHDWNGTEDRLDRSGRIIEKGQPGIPALLEAVRSQVQNSHNTNLRDDMDGISKKLDEHIAISKHQDRLQNKTAEKLAAHLEQTDEWHEMLEDLHEKWSDRKTPPESGPK